jgi:hypothetical protein
MENFHRQAATVIIADHPARLLHQRPLPPFTALPRMGTQLLRSADAKQLLALPGPSPLG